MKKSLLIFGLILFGFISCTIGETDSVNNVSHIDFTESNQVLLDVRTPEEFAEGHLPDAININLKSDKFEEIIDTLDKNKTYYVYCRSEERRVGKECRTQ